MLYPLLWSLLHTKNVRFCHLSVAILSVKSCCASVFIHHSNYHIAENLVGIKFGGLLRINSSKNIVYLAVQCGFTMCVRTAKPPNFPALWYRVNAIGISSFTRSSHRATGTCSIRSLAFVTEHPGTAQSSS